MMADGSSFGKTDPNIKKGMSVDKCTQIILKSIQLRIAEMSVGGTVYKIFFYLSNIFPQEFTDYLLD
jgi:hypothetical protein